MGGLRGCIQSFENFFVGRRASHTAVFKQGKVMIRFTVLENHWVRRTKCGGWTEGGRRRSREVRAEGQ